MNRKCGAVRCENELPTENKKAKYCSGACKTAEYNRKKREGKPDYWKQKYDPARRRMMYMQAEYGLKPDDYRLMYEQQNGKCAICKVGPANNIDHDHDTGVVRGLLCRPCNLSLGYLRDDTRVLAEAIAYLERSRLK